MRELKDVKAVNAWKYEAVLCIRSNRGERAELFREQQKMLKQLRIVEMDMRQ